MRTQDNEEPFQWETHNLDKMITSVNHLLGNIGINASTLRIRVDGDILYMGQGTQYRGNTQIFGDIVHTMLITLMAVRDSNKKYLEKLRDIVKFEVIEDIDFELALLDDKEIE